MLSYFHPFNVFLGTGEKNISIRYAWTRIFFQAEEEISVFKKFPDTCRGGLNVRLEPSIHHFCTPHPSINYLFNSLSDL